MNTYIIASTSNSEDLIQILNKRVKIKGIIGLSNKTKNKKKISGFRYLKKIAKEESINFIEVYSYDLSKEKDKISLSKLHIDYLIIAGWQRLLPGWLLEKVKICTIGCHGSSQGITKGRGRSPQNWSIILNEKFFYLSIFKVDVGIDSGDILDTRKFVYSVYDDIKSSYYKTILLYGEMLSVFLKRDIKSAKLIKQKNIDAKYLPQRIPEDGFIDWNQNSEDIKNFVNALTKPYPGAYSTFDNGVKIIIWKSIPFSIELKIKHKVGQLVKIFAYNDLLVKTKDSYLLISEFEIVDHKKKLKEGTILKSKNFNNQIKNIVNRHKKNYPKQKISQLILKKIS